MTGITQSLNCNDDNHWKPISTFPWGLCSIISFSSSALRGIVFPVFIRGKQKTKQTNHFSYILAWEIDIFATVLTFFNWKKFSALLRNVFKTPPLPPVTFRNTFCNPLPPLIALRNIWTAPNPDSGPVGKDRLRTNLETRINSDLWPQQSHLQTFVESDTDIGYCAVAEHPINRRYDSCMSTPKS
jgi:hypothetical protein